MHHLYCKRSLNSAAMTLAGVHTSRVHYSSAAWPSLTTYYKCRVQHKLCVLTFRAKKVSSPYILELQSPSTVMLSCRSCLAQGWRDRACEKSAPQILEQFPSNPANHLTASGNHISSDLNMWCSKEVPMFKPITCSSHPQYLLHILAYCCKSWYNLSMYCIIQW